MQIETFHFNTDAGWSIPHFPALDSPNTLVLAFCAPEYYDNPKPLEELKQAFPNSHVAGCSTSGEIFNNLLNDHSISIAVVKFDHSQIELVTTKIEKHQDSHATGIDLAKKINKKNLKGILLLSDGLLVNANALISGMRQIIPNEISISGGFAGDGNNFKKTWVLERGLPCVGAVNVIGFYGDNIDIGYASKSGWNIFGPERLITKSKDNVVYEIDGQSALSLYKKYLGYLASELPASGLIYPLALSDKPFTRKTMIRTMLGIDEKKQSITFAGNVPQGWYGQLMTTSFNNLIENAKATGMLVKNFIHQNNQSLNVAISSVGRRFVLGERAEEEIENAYRAIGKPSPLVGFYSYGEISPNPFLGELHNNTIAFCTISERVA